MTSHGADSGWVSFGQKIPKPDALCAMEIGGGNGMINVNHLSLEFLVLISRVDDHSRHKEL